MGKAKELLGLIASITEEGEAGPLNLAVGAKVKFKSGDQDMAGEICAGEDGSCYNQAEDSYCVKVGDSVMMVKSSDLTVGEAAKPKTPVAPKKPNHFKKTRNENANEEGEEVPAEAPAADDKLAKMDAYMGTLKECMGKMREEADPEKAPNTSAAIDALDAQADMLKEAYEGELNHNPDGGGAGDGGTEIPTPA